MATLESASKYAIGWSRAKISEGPELSELSIGRIRRAFAFKPFRAAGVKLVNDPLFVEKL